MKTHLPTRRTQRSAGDLQTSLASLLTGLVQIPSRAGTDSYEQILGCIACWLEARDVAFTFIRGESGRDVGLAGSIGSAPQAQAVVLNACVDTAGFGDLAAWKHHPTGAEVEENFLYGRGSADSKAGIAIFCHLLAAFRNQSFARRLAFVFDADEHNGYFSGIRTWLDGFEGPIAGVLIGYPGHDQIGVGARGFWRATLRVSGRSAHSGSSHHHGVNAISKAARLIASLTDLQNELAGCVCDAFRLPPKFTVTGIRSGGEFSVVPDSCEVDVDVRLTPFFKAEDAEAKLQALIRLLDDRYPSPTRSYVVEQGAVAAYVLPTGSPLSMALGRASEHVLGRRLPYAVTGPSNVGNLLAERGIAATCGFGVSYRNMHAPEECVDLASLLPSYLVYERALKELLDISD